MTKKINTLLLSLLFLLPCLGAEADTARHTPTAAHSAVERCFAAGVYAKMQRDNSSSYDLLRFCVQSDSTFSPAYNALVKYELFLKNKEKALLYLLSATKYAPDNYWYRSNLANFYLNSGDVDNGIKVYEELVKKNPHKMQPMYTLASLYLNKSEYSKSIKLYDKIEEENGHSVEIFVSKMQALVMAGNTKKAVADLQKALEKEPDMALYKLLLADIYAGEERYDEAIRLYEACRQSDPENTDVLRALLSVYRTCDFDKYKALLTEVMADNQIADQFKMGLFGTIFNDGKTKDDSTFVAQVLSAAVASGHSASTDIPMLAAQYFYSKNDTAALIAPLDTIMRRNPANELANYQLLQIYANRNDVPNVVAVAENAVKHIPAEPLYYFYLTLGYLNEGRRADATRICESGVEKITDDSTSTYLASQLYSMLGDLYHEAAREKDAFAAYDNALRYDPDNSAVLNNYAYFLAVKGENLDKAENMISRADELKPNDPTILDTYAWVLFRKGEYELARQQIDAVLAANVDPDAVIYEHAGDIYYKCGEKETAVRYWKKAQEKGSESKTLPKKIAESRYVEDEE